MYLPVDALSVFDIVESVPRRRPAATCIEEVPGVSQAAVEALETSPEGTHMSLDRLTDVSLQGLGS